MTSGRVLGSVGGTRTGYPPRGHPTSTRGHRPGQHSRRCRLTHEVVLWVVLAMGMFTDVPIRQVFKLPGGFASASSRRTAPASAWRGSGWAWPRCGTCSSGSSARWPGPRRRGLLPRLAADGHRRHGLRRPRLRRQRRRLRPALGGPRGDGAFPQIRKLSLVELGTHAEVGLVVQADPHAASGRWSPGLLRHLDPEMLLLLDRGFFSYELLAGAGRRAG